MLSALYDQLLTFGIHGWNLNADDILNIALRHRERLKGLRLREVCLKEGSMWKDILGPLRDSMHRLEWLSLTDIGYVRHPEPVPGAEVSDEPLSSDGEMSSDETGDSDSPTAGPSNAPHIANGHTSDNEDADMEDDTDSEDSDDNEANETEFVDPNSIDTPTSAPWCNCNGHTFPGTADDLDDDGYSMSRSKRRRWEKWVLRRCPEHSE